MYTIKITFTYFTFHNNCVMFHCKRQNYYYQSKEITF